MSDEIQVRSSPVKPRIVVAEDYRDEALAKLGTVGEVLRLTSYDRPSLLAAVDDASALLVRSYAQVTAEVIGAAKRLTVIGRGGVGLENVDLAAARDRGIAVVYTPEASTRAVAEFTIGLMIALERQIASADARSRTGENAVALRSALMGRELAGLTLGIIGLGRVGKAVAAIAYHGLGMRIVYNDIVEMGLLSFVATRVTKEELFASSDVISLHVPLTEQTRGLCGPAVFSAMKPSSTLINTCRGAVVDCLALAHALCGDVLAGAALDVTDPEPLPLDHPLFSAPHTLLTPHVAARTPDSLRRMNDVVDDIVAVLQGRPPRFSAGR